MFAARRIAGLVLALATAGCAGESDVDRRSVVLITLDTTRCDALGAFGGPPEVTPNLDRLAAQSIRFLQARTVAPLTLPAHASMFTGLYPPRHTVRGNGPMTLPREATTVAELAQAAGFQTAGFVGGLTLDRAYGAAQGFEHWTQPKPSPQRVQGQVGDRPANEVVADARAWLAARDRERPFLLWVHVFDAHAPYAPPAEPLARAGGDPYLGEAAFADAELGRLFDDLEHDGTLARALLLVVADHGEGRGDHGEDTHGLHGWDTTIRVPLFVRFPDGKGPGVERHEPVSVADVAPTLLEWMQLEVPPDLDGLSLLSLPRHLERGVYFESLSGYARFGWSPLVGWCDLEGKYVHSSAPQFFRVFSDPREEHDLAGELGAQAERYVAALRHVLARPPLAVEKPELAASEAVQAIAELGYGGHDAAPVEVPDPLAPSDRPAPHERLAEYAEFTAAQALVLTGHYAEAVAKLEPLVAANPWNSAALDELGSALVELKRWREAAEVLERRAKLPPERLHTLKNLVRCYTELGDAEQARAHTLRSLELFVATHELRGEPELAAHYRALLESQLGPRKQ